MSWGAAVIAVAVGVAIMVALVAVLYQTTCRDEILHELRGMNATLLRSKFGPEYPAQSSAWHRLLDVREEPIISEGVLLGLRQICWIEDQAGRHWRAIVANQRGRSGTVEVRELGESNVIAPQWKQPL